jgi:DNA-directed RNA polymerase specialized sigma24 family protein
VFVSTRSSPQALPAFAPGGPRTPQALAQELATVADAHRGRLLSMHRRRLRFEDLEDCYGQATLELLAQAQRGELRCVSRAHMRNVLEQRFVSRVLDRRRALAGRSPAQALLEGALSLGEPGDRELQVVDGGATVERTVMLRDELRRLTRAAIEHLSEDQRLVIASQVAARDDRAEFCRRHGWSEEKYRKVAQRGRGRLRRALGETRADGDSSAEARAASGADRGARGGVPLGDPGRSN